MTDPPQPERPLAPPQSHTVVRTVTADDTALALGSGDLPVLATPRLLAWCEAATCGALDVADTDAVVGTRVDLEHLAAAAVGAEVSATATIAHRDGRLVRFRVVAHDSAGKLLGSGEVQKVVVDRARFMQRVIGVED